MKTTKGFDKFDQPIGDGSRHVNYDIRTFAEYPFIQTKVSKSATSETVYVYYINPQNNTHATVRFSWHTSWALECGDVLYPTCSDDAILYKLGLRKRRFIPNRRVVVPTTQIKKKDVCKYEMLPLTIQDLYALGEGADISEYNGKVCKDSNYLICGDTIKGYDEDRGRYEYSKIEEPQP